MLPVHGRRKLREHRERGSYESYGVAVVVLLACALLALSMSQKMVLQHHYGHHMFGDDLAQGAKLSVRSHNRHHPLPHSGLRGTVQDVVEEVEAGVATVEERLTDELHGFQHAPPGMEPEAFIDAAWGDTANESRPLFSFWCSAAPSLPDVQRAAGLRGGAAQPPPLHGGQPCTFLASFDGEWEHMVSAKDAAGFRPGRPLDWGEHTLRVRAVDSTGHVQIAPTVLRFTVDAGDEEPPEHREIRALDGAQWTAPAGGADAVGGADAAAHTARLVATGHESAGMLQVAAERAAADTVAPA